MKKIISILLSAAIVSGFPISASADSFEDHMFFEPEITYYDEDDTSHPEIWGDGYYIDDGYDLVYELFEDYDLHDTRRWRTDSKEADKTIRLRFYDGSSTPGFVFFGIKSCAKLTVRIPDTVNGIPVSELYESCNFKAFDVNPKNKYLKSDGQAVFSKDGKKLFSYARHNESTEYSVPQGTEIICYAALWDCDNIKSIHIPDSVKYIEAVSFKNMDSLESIAFGSFALKIDRNAFELSDTLEPKADFICTEKNDIVSNGNRLSWEKINGVSHYEIYQKLNNGEYKLLKTTKATGCVFPTLKSGNKYTFSVKPVAVIPAANYNKEKDEGRYPKTFTIEGIMSEDITVTGK